MYFVLETALIHINNTDDKPFQNIISVLHIQLLVHNPKEMHQQTLHNGRAAGQCNILYQRRLLNRQPTTSPTTIHSVYRANRLTESILMSVKVILLLILPWKLPLKWIARVVYWHIRWWWQGCNHHPQQLKTSILEISRFILLSDAYNVTKFQWTVSLQCWSEEWFPWSENKLRLLYLSSDANPTCHE